MFEGFLGQDNARLTMCNEEAAPVYQGDVGDGGSLGRFRKLACDIGRNVVRSELDDAKPFGDRQTADCEDELLDGHAL